MRTNRILWLIDATLALIAGLVGTVYPDLYRKTIPDEFLLGLISQDIMSVIASLILLILLIKLKDSDLTKILIIIGIIGFYFYAYGIYVIEQVYTLLYLVYMAIFSLSFFSLIYSISNLKKDELQKITIPPPLRFGCLGYLFINASIFYFLWISQLIPLMKIGDRIEYMFSIFIFDLCFIMPSSIILAIMNIKEKALGKGLIPSFFIVGCFILFPLVIAEIAKPLLFESPILIESLLLYLILPLILLSLTIMYFWKGKMTD